MVENIIANPAAVVSTVGSRANGSAVQAKPVSETAGRTISQLSRARAANGDTRLSAESLQAIRNGAIAPSVTKPEEQTPAVEEDNSLSDTTQRVFDSIEVSQPVTPDISTALDGINLNLSSSPSAVTGTQIDIVV